MNRNSSLLVGGGLVLLGLFGLVVNILFSIFHISIPLWQVWRVWPIFVIGIGLLLVAPPVFSPKNRGMGYLFIPGSLILAAGSMLMIASLFSAWETLTYWWPVYLLSLGVGFFLAAVFARNIYLIIPGLVIFLNGVVMQFCSLTGQWELWAVLWAVEPLSIGLGLLVVGLGKRSGVALGFAFVLCAFTGIAFFSTSALHFSGSWLLRYGGPAILIFAGAFVLLLGLVNKPSGSGKGGSNGPGEALEETLA